MASELLKTKALSARIKEPKVRDFDFGLNLTSVESLIPDLPEPKPPELLDIQEDNRKGRLLDSLNKIGGGLEDSSLDFINRENFKVGGDVSKAYKVLSERLNRAPSLAEMRVETGLSYNGIKNNLGDLKLSEGRTRNEGATKAAVEAAKNKRKIFDNTIKEPLSKDLEKRYQYVQGNELSLIHI